MGDETEVRQSVSDLPVQDPPGEEFSAADLRWAKNASSEHHCDDVALVPYDRLEAFISGECNNPEHPTRFHIEGSRKRVSGTMYCTCLPPATSPALLAMLLLNACA
jgi:hypothetical protein